MSKNPTWGMEMIEGPEDGGWVNTLTSPGQVFRVPRYHAVNLISPSAMIPVEPEPLDVDLYQHCGERLIWVGKERP